jgi:hypothetical protein
LGDRKKKPTSVPVISETSLIGLAVFMQELGKNGWLSVFLIFFWRIFVTWRQKNKGLANPTKGFLRFKNKFAIS